MPLQSREVITLRLILDCDCGIDDDAEELVKTKGSGFASHLLSLPVEVRLKILRYLLRFDYNRESHTRRPPDGSINQLLQLDARRILEAPQFRHKGKQEINGLMPLRHTCQISPAILKTCSVIYWEARSVLYVENRVVALQSGVKGLGARLKNYGIPMFGPLASARLAEHARFNDEAPRKRESVINDKSQRTASITPGPLEAVFDPVILFRGQKPKPDTPFYICSYKDAADLLHGLWIMIKSPFARGMRFSLHLTSNPKFRLLSSSDGFVRYAVLPWLHNHVNHLSCDDTKSERIDSLRKRLDAHKTASQAESNIYTYNTICGYLEQLMLSAEKSAEKGSYVKAEMLYERICYESCSIVRTRTGKLVDVSTKTKEGINRVCKLIAISAYRLCELRSGTIATSQTPRASTENTTAESRKNSQTDETASFSDHAAISETTIVPPIDVKLEHQSRATFTTCSSPPPSPSKVESIKTTRLEGSLARDLAIMSGMLALRLPCATPVPEWNTRLNIMLLRLFAEQGDYHQARCCIRRIHQNCNVLLKEAKAKNKTAGKYKDLDTLVIELSTKMDEEKGDKAQCFTTAERCQEVVRKLWGDRLAPKKGYIGLIWTFRWA